MGGSNYQHPVALHWDQGPQKLKKLKNKLHAYFQSKNKSDGGECEIRDIDCSRGYILIHFREEAARDRVLQKTNHQLILSDGATLQLIVRIPDEGNAQCTKSSRLLRDDLPPPRDIPADLQDPKIHQNPGEQEKPTREDDEATQCPPSSVVLIENLQDSYAPEVLNLLVENISKKNEDSDFYVERISEIQAAVVTFTSGNDIPDFIGMFSRNPRVIQQNLRAKYLEETRSIRVEGLPASTSEDFLELYFESAKHGGGPIEKKEMLAEEGVAVITFCNPEVVKTVLTKQHRYSNATLSVYPYYPSIGQWLYGKNKKHIRTPDPVKFPISANILEFICNTAQAKENIEKQMADNYCDVEWPGPDHHNPVITLSFPSYLSKHLRTLAKIGASWGNNVTTHFSLLMSNYKVIECDVKPPVWEAIQGKISSSPYEGVLIRPEAATEKVYIVGISEDVMKIEPQFKKLVEETTRQVMRVEDEVPLALAAYKLMLAHGLEKSLLEDSPHVKISYDGVTERIKLDGPKDEVFTAKCKVLNTLQGLKSKLIHLDPHIIHFLMAADNAELSRSLLKSKGTKAMFQVEDNAVVLTGYSDKDLRNTEETLKKELVCKQISVEDETLMRSPEWRSLKTFLNESYNAQGRKFSIHERTAGDGIKVVIAGLSSLAEEVYQHIHDFIKRNVLVKVDIELKLMPVLQFIEEESSQEWKRILQNVTVTKKQNFTSISGTEIYVKEAKDYVTSISSTLHSDILIIDKPGAKKFCIGNEDMYINTAKNKFGCVINFQKDEDGRSSGHELNQDEPRCQVNLHNKVTMVVYKGDLCQHSVDVIIIASQKDLKPTGGPALALLKAAGPKLQRELEDNVQKDGELLPGECMITHAGNLPCQKVIHAVGPKWTGKSDSKCERLLRKVISRSLETAQDNGLTSAAISLASFIVSGIPADVCAENIPKSIQLYAENQEDHPCIKRIHLIENDEQVLKGFTEALKAEYGEQIVEVAPKKSKKKYLKKTPRREDTVRERDLSMVATKEGVHVNVIQGNIEDATTDVVVNSVGKELDLNFGAVSKALFRKAGNNLQKLLNSQREGKEVKEGSIFVTGGCNLSCDTVIHVVVPQWDGGSGSSEKTLGDIVRKCLHEAEERRKASVTFPAVGTGALCFPGALVAALMFEEVLNFSSKTKPVNVKEVNFMLHPKDAETIKAFSAELEKKIGSHKDAGKIRTSAQGAHEMRIGSVIFQVKRGDGSQVKGDFIVRLSYSPSETRELQNFGGTPLKTLSISEAFNADWLKQSVMNVLQECESRKYKCLAFSAMQSGSQTVSFDVVAGALLDAVTEFVASHSPKLVQKVKVITPIQQTLDDFLWAMKMREGSAAAKQSSGWLSRMTKSVVNYFTGHKEEEDDPQVFELRENIEPAIIYLCAKHQDAVDKTKTWLHELITKEQYEMVIKDQWIQEFDDKDDDPFELLQSKYQVTLTFDFSESTIKVLGMCRDVMEVTNTIQEMIKNVRDKKMKEREAELCSNVVEWGYLRGRDFVPFDKMCNLELEKAKNEDRQSTHVAINGEKYTVILERMTARNSKGTTWKVQRKSKHELQEPPHWEEMKTCSMKVVPLSPGSTEYKTVQTEFEKSCLMKIIKIERIQNKHLWLNYQIRKSAIDHKNGGNNNERLLFHGTDADAIENVNNNGFNRSYAGKNDAQIGKGTYFAVEAIYSSDETYAKCDAQGHQRMYLARVLTGIFCTGRSAMIAPPPKDNANPTDLHDSVADSTTKPTVFAIFNDIQAYPEYLITFTCDI